VNADRHPDAPLPDITVHRPEPSAKSSDQPTDNAGKENKENAILITHLWLDIMDKFAEGIYSIKFDKYLEDPTLPKELKKDVRICLIDDGVDVTHRSITERIENGGWSFDRGYQGEEYRGMTRPYYESAMNHGTLMANLICRVCPNAKIISYRLDTRPGEGDKIHFTAKSAADVS